MTMTSDIGEDIAGAVAARLRRDEDALRGAWESAPAGVARHVMIDNLLEPGLTMRIYRAFPPESEDWRRLDSFRERKKTFAKLDRIDPLIGAATDAFQQPDVVAAVAAITGMRDLEPDPSLYAGGVSKMDRGDFLNPHIDNSHNADRTRYRRLNLLFYVSPDWRAEHGGNLELWDSHVKTPLEIPSLFNRLVIMETDRTSWHSVNPVVADAARCCVSNYYFSAASPDGADYYHVTSFMGRPEQPFLRFVNAADNMLRQQIASRLKISRGKKLRRLPENAS
ncbi:2OG-Fe(II) oxygenase [Hyphococcus luteus]|uniref:2OG-Fe(II) oxygenase n=1 Tax=Hyphococcus luteus TaxID=2058213 RepID=A0A2S7K1Z5_9PROT|nr:2OG-Fe(II) oxygenase [Marinicaulis flavus]PQA86535.1 2OG-Fe(II) oxygenase [Marinicaulis flavus]